MKAKNKVLIKIRNISLISIYLLVALTIGFLISLLVYYLRDGNLYACKSLGSDPSNSFNDFFEILDLAESTDLSKNSNPAFALLIGRFFTLFGLRNCFGSNIYIYNAISYTIFILIPIVILFYLFYKYMKNRLSNHQIIVLYIVLLFSSPFVYVFCKGNFILYAFMFVVLYLYFYNSETKIKKELSYVFLAMAGSMKFYPLIFGVFIIRKKDFIGFCKTALYFTFIFICSFFCLKNGMRYLPITIRNIFNYSGYNDFVIIDGTKCISNGISYDISFKSFMSIIYFIFNRVSFVSIVTNSLYSYTILFIKIIILIILLIICLTNRNKFYSLLSCSLICCFIINPSFIYTTIFLYLPFVWSLKNLKTFNHDIKFIICYCCLILLFVSINFGETNISVNYGLPTKITINQIIKSISLFCLLVITILDYIFQFYNNIKTNNPKKRPI